MAKQLIRSVQDICADCGQVDPNWASLNRGILICDECCLIHRSLGRNISQVKSIGKSNWRLSQIQMIIELHRSGANSVWEHTLLDPLTGKSGARKKPSPKDPLHPNKSEFIRSKYQNLSFINRSTTKEESETDISEQLHSSVRTPNLKTSLRLLASGANLNYIHNEKYNSPLHMAAKSGQISQIELLIVYGANPSIVDVKGKTPIDYAKEANFNEIVERLIECQYELSDRLTYFVCGRTPDHKNGQHFLIPEMIDSNEQSEDSRLKLQSLSHRLFEELSRDVYDEIDRREIDAIYNAIQTLNTQTLNNDKQIVPFLPVNPEFSSTRNQGRQKLARLNSKEFATLIIDVLCEIRRRLHGMPSIQVSKRSISNVLKPTFIKNSAQRQLGSDESSDYDSEPLYDSVPSEDEDMTHSKAQPNRPTTSSVSAKRTLPIKQSAKKENPNSSVSLDDYCVLKDQLCRSDSLIQELVLGNKDMRYEITRLQIMVQKLIDENAQLRAVVIPKSTSNSINWQNSSSEGPPPEIMPRTVNKTHTRPQSMYERPIPSSCPTKSSSSLNNLQHNSMIPSQSPSSLVSSHLNEHNNNQMSSNHLKDGNDSCVHSKGESISASTDSFRSKFMLSFPTKEEVLRKTEQITRRIQELLTTAQEGKHEDFESCSNKINSAVAQMIGIFPETFAEMSSFPNGDQIFLALSQLHKSALKLRFECRASLNLNLPTHQHLQQDFRVIYQKVIESAFEIAKSAKILVTLFH